MLGEALWIPHCADSKFDIDADNNPHGILFGNGKAASQNAFQL